MERHNNIIRSIAEVKKENQKLEELLNYVETENFEYALKCNHLENILSNIVSITKNTPAKLIEASDNIYNILQRCSTASAAPIVNASPINETKRPKLTPEKLVACNKAHVVKPHMVNGTILYVPTINLTRVSEVQSPSTSKKSTHSKNENSSMESCGANDGTNNGTAQQSTSSNELNENSESGEAGTSAENSEFNDSQHSMIEDVSEPSTSTAKSHSHSTVLSGTFQEVKIYLNQISPERLNEELRNQISIRRGSRQKRSNSNKSFGLITKRKKT